MSASGIEVFELRDKVALVTGAASGIGLAITEKLLCEGAKVMMVDINQTEGQKVFSRLSEKYPRDNISFTTCDITNVHQLADVFSQTKGMFGGLDIVCNNAGIVDGEHIWRRMFDVNVFAVIEGTQLALKYMSVANGNPGGVIINTASIAGLINIGTKMAKYGATKHAVVGYSRSMAMNEDGVRINCICPGSVDTPGMHKLSTNPAMKFSQLELDIMKAQEIRPEDVGDGVIELIKDISKNGAVMMVLKDTDGQIKKEFCDLMDYSKL